MKILPDVRHDKKSHRRRRQSYKISAEPELEKSGEVKRDKNPFLCSWVEQSRRPVQFGFNQVTLRQIFYIHLRRDTFGR